MNSGRVVYFNGKFLSKEEAKISICESGLIVGDMVIDMTRSFNKKQFKLRAHIDRLYSGYMNGKNMVMYGGQSVW